MPKLGKLQRIVWQQLRSVYPNGLTDLELEARCGSHGSTYRTRRAELVAKGLVVDSGQKKRQQGGLRIVWKVANPDQPLETGPRLRSLFDEGDE